VTHNVHGHGTIASTDEYHTRISFDEHGVSHLRGVTGCVDALDRAAVGSIDDTAPQVLMRDRARNVR
jgi:hypothetical protein